MPFVDVEDQRIYYVEYHPKDAASLPIILVHGAGGSRLDWPKEIRRLPQQRVIIPDLPGHGKSAEPGRVRVDDYAKSIACFADALDIPCFIAAGHSMGGAIVQMLALDYGERLAGAILIGTGARLKVHRNILEQILVTKVEVANMLREWIWGPVATDDMRDLTYGKFMALPPTVIHGDYVACNEFDVRERVHDIDTPTLIIGAEHDKMTPLRYSQYLNEKIPDSELFVVENAGHMMTVEEPQLVANAISNWLQRRIESKP